jgi:hypothetical protein
MKSHGVGMSRIIGAVALVLSLAPLASRPDEAEMERAERAQAGALTRLTVAQAEYARALRDKDEEAIRRLDVHNLRVLDAEADEEEAAALRVAEEERKAAPAPGGQPARDPGADPGEAKRLREDYAALSGRVDQVSLARKSAILGEVAGRAERRVPGTHTPEERAATKETARGSTTPGQAVKPESGAAGAPATGGATTLQPPAPGQ